MANKKLLLSGAALAAAAAVLAGGTFAWQSISQTALNEASDVINPGGRLHDDFDGKNKDVYVENFAEEDIFARIRLDEYFEIVLNAGTPGEKTVPMIGSKTEKTDGDGNVVTNDEGQTLYDYTYETFKGYTDGGTVQAGLKTEDEEIASWWNWTTGGETVFMPTFNKNKDSLQADINGTYLFDTGVITDKDVAGGQYSTMETYEEAQSKTAYALYDIDSNQVDEIAEEDLDGMIENGTVAAEYEANVKALQEDHAAKKTGNASLISMSDWLAMVGNSYDEETHGNYWVYDTDGWVYWSAPIKPGEATGLLLDEITLSDLMDDSWYYAINVVGQFVTADDVGEEDGTGFYATADGNTVPTTQARILLARIGAGSSVVEVSNGADLQTAVNAGGTVALASDIATSSMLTISGDVTLDMNGKTLTRNSNASASDYQAVITIESGKVTLSGNGTLNGNGSNIRGIIVKNNAELTVTGNGTYIGSVYAVYTRNSGKAYLQGGNFRIRGGDFNYLRADNSSQIVLSGGNYGTKEFYNNGRNISLAEGYEWQDNANGTFDVVKKAE